MEMIRIMMEDHEAGCSSRPGYLVARFKVGSGLLQLGSKL